MEKNKCVQGLKRTERSKIEENGYACVMRKLIGTPAAHQKYTKLYKNLPSCCKYSCAFPESKTT